MTSCSLRNVLLIRYATSKGYDVLSQINPGDGFWVNALQAFTFNSFATPTLTSTFPTTITGVNGTISATLTSDVNSLAYFAIVESTSTAPTAPQLIAGKNASNVAYSNKGKVLLSAGTPFTSSLSISTLIGTAPFKLYLTLVNTQDAARYSQVFSADLSYPVPSY